MKYMKVWGFPMLPLPGLAGTEFYRALFTADSHVILMPSVVALIISPAYYSAISALSPKDWSTFQNLLTAHFSLFRRLSISRPQGPSPCTFHFIFNGKSVRQILLYFRSSGINVPMFAFILYRWFASSFSDYFHMIIYYCLFVRTMVTALESSSCLQYFTPHCRRIYNAE